MILCAMVVASSACVGDGATRNGVDAVGTPVEESEGSPSPTPSSGKASAGRISVQGGEVVLKIQPGSLDGKRPPLYRIVNRTVGEIGFGYPYVLSIKENGTWGEIKNHPRCVFTLPLLLLQPGERSEAMTIGRCDEDGGTQLPSPGLHRVEKQVELADGSRIPISATFEVTPTT